MTTSEGDLKHNTIGCLLWMVLLVVASLVAGFIFMWRHGGRQSVQVTAGERQCWEEVVLVSGSMGTVGEAQWLEGSETTAAHATGYRYSTDAPAHFSYDLDITIETTRHVDSSGNTVRPDTYDFTYDYCLGVNAATEPGLYEFDAEVRFGATSLLRIPYEVEVLAP